MDAERERAEFEAWMRREHPGVPVRVQNLIGTYSVSSVDAAWDGWLARAAAAPVAVQAGEKQGDLSRSSGLDPSGALVPEGWQLVPIEPTPEMLREMVKMAEGPAVYKVMSEKGLRVLEADAADAYTAALSVAPRTGLVEGHGPDKPAPSASPASPGGTAP